MSRCRDKKCEVSDKSKYVNKLKACEIKAKEIKACTVSAITTNTENFFVNDQKFFPSSIPTPITNSTVMPLTEEGRYRLAENITKQVKITGNNISIDLGNLTISNDNDCALLIEGASKVYIENGFIESLNNTAICVNDSFNVAFRSINTQASKSGMKCVNTVNLFVLNYFVQHISEFAASFENCVELFMGQASFSDLTFTDYLFRIIDTDIVWMEKISFTRISIQDFGTKDVFSFRKSNDIFVNNVSFYQSNYSAAGNLNLYNIHLDECLSVTIDNLTVTGEVMNINGAFNGVHNCVKVEKSENVFIQNGLFNGNDVRGSTNSEMLENITIYFEDTFDSVLKTMKMNSNSVSGGGLDTKMSVGGFLSLRGGNCVVVGCTSDVNTVGTTESIDTKAVGYEVIDPESTYAFVSNGSNDNGNRNTMEAGGFKVAGEGTTDSFVEFKSCLSNNNSARKLVYSFRSELSNTLFMSCSASSNEIKNELNKIGAFGILLTGSLQTVQINPSVYSSTANGNSALENDQFKKKKNGLGKNSKKSSRILNGVDQAYGLYAGKIDLGFGMTKGVRNLIVKNCDLCSNNVGIHLQEADQSSVLGNYVNLNVSETESGCGIKIVNGFSNSVISNSAIGCDIAVSVEEAENCDLSKNLASKCKIGFQDTTEDGNIYITNLSSSCDVPFQTAFPVALFALDKSTGVYDFLSGHPDLTAFTNIQA